MSIKGSRNQGRGRENRLIKMRLTVHLSLMEVLKRFGSEEFASELSFKVVTSMSERQLKNAVENIRKREAS